MESFLKHQPKKVVKFIPYEKHSISLSNSTITKILDLKKNESKFQIWLKRFNASDNQAKIINYAISEYVKLKI